jgi:hypothetical protein
MIASGAAVSAGRFFRLFPLADSITFSLSFTKQKKNENSVSYLETFY